MKHWKHDFKWWVRAVSGKNQPKEIPIQFDCWHVFFSTSQIQSSLHKRYYIWESANLINGFQWTLSKVSVCEPKNDHLQYIYKRKIERQAQSSCFSNITWGRVRNIYKYSGYQRNILFLCTVTGKDSLPDPTLTRVTYLSELHDKHYSEFKFSNQGSA